MMDTILSSDTSVLTTVTRRNIPENGILHSHLRENLKSYIPAILSTGNEILDSGGYRSEKIPKLFRIRPEMFFPSGIKFYPVFQYPNYSYLHFIA
jgi:hypothetical protein